MKSIQRLGFSCIVLALLLVSPVVVRAEQQTAANPLLQYVQTPDESYQWRLRQHQKVAGGELSELTLVSQTWHNIVWKHRVFFFKPEKVLNPEHALMIVAGSSWRDSYDQPPRNNKHGMPRKVQAITLMAAQLGIPVVAILQVPHQPIFGRLYEDAAIAHSFVQCLKTADPTWPLLLPMVKSAVRAMDAAQAYGKEKLGLNIKKFTVTGGSKRGWTTWLTAAVDQRVQAIVPMVYDILNMSVQLAHQERVWGGISESIHDYTERGLIEEFNTPNGKQLAQIVDPYTYRDRITQPKLIVLGTNDSYWPIDALNHYWNDLHGSKYVLYVPNKGHKVNDIPRVLGAIAGMLKHAQGLKQLPQQSCVFDVNDRTVSLKFTTDQQAANVVVWKATSPISDFRRVTWKSEFVERAEQHFQHSWDVPDDQFGAIFVEATYADRQFPLMLSSTVQVVPASNAEDDVSQ